MIRDDEHWMSVADGFYAAAVGEQTWYSALEQFAEATGSKAGQLIGLGAGAAVPFNVMTGVGEDFAAEFAAIGGGDPGVNPRVRAGADAAPLRVLTEADFITPHEYRRDAHVQEVVRRWDLAYVCLSTLHRTPDMLVGLAVARSQRQGHIGANERECFASIAPHVRAAVRAQLALEGQGSALLAGALEALSIPAFVCDARGFVQALTPAAERLVSEGGRLQLVQGRLRASAPADAAPLEQAIDEAARGRPQPGAPLSRTVVIRSRAADLPLAVDVIALPRQRDHELAFNPRALVVAHTKDAGTEEAAARRSLLLQAGYGLTPTEADVALRLADGNTAEAIALARAVSLDTVRTQIKAIRAKLHADNQVELIARLHRL